MRELVIPYRPPVGLHENIIVMLDDDIYEKIKGKRFNVVRNRSRDVPLNTAIPTYFRFRENGEYVYLHRYIINASKSYLVDHKNRNTYDNRRANLRLATRSQNSSNKRKYINSNKYIGVVGRNDNWSAQVQSGVIVYRATGLSSENKAAQVYNELAELLHGEFASKNHIVT